MKTPDGYKALAAKRLPILLQIQSLHAELEKLDAPFIADLARYYTDRGWANPTDAAKAELKKLHKKFDPK